MQRQQIRGACRAFGQSISMTNEALAPILDGCLRHDRQAQNRLYRAFFPYVRAIASRYATSEEDTREIVQDAFFKAFTHIARFKIGDAPFQAWLRRITINTAIDRYRAQLREVDTVELAPQHENAESVAHALLDMDAEHLLHFVRQLSPAYRAAFNLYAVEGFDYQEIANTLGINIGTVKSNIAKARMRLKAMLERSQMNENHAR